MLVELLLFTSSTIFPIFFARRAVFTRVLPSPAVISISFSEPNPTSDTGTPNFAAFSSDFSSRLSVSSPSVNTKIYWDFADCAGIAESAASLS